MVTWVSWGLVAVGVALVTATVMSLSGRLRPLRRALRRLSWRAEDLARLQAGAEALSVRAAEFTAQAEAIRAARGADQEATDSGRGG